MSQEITMLCYKNRTWCNFKNCTKFNVSKCDRAYTDSIDQRAHVWWNHKKDLLIDMCMSVVLAEGIVNESPSAIIENSKEGFPFLPCNLN